MEIVSDNMPKYSHEIIQFTQPMRNFVTRFNELAKPLGVPLLEIPKKLSVGYPYPPQKSPKYESGTDEGDEWDDEDD